MPPRDAVDPSSLDLHLGTGTPHGVKGVRQKLAEADSRGLHGALVPPAWLPTDENDLPAELAVTALCGYPRGHHNILVKAAEARFAVQFGVPAVLVVADPAIIDRGDVNAFTAEIVALREAVSPQIGLSIALDAAVVAEAELPALAQAAARAGADALAVMGGAQDDVPAKVRVLAETGGLPVTALGVDDWRGSPGDTAELLDAGARIVASADLPGEA